MTVPFTGCCQHLGDIDRQRFADRSQVRRLQDRTDWHVVGGAQHIYRGAAALSSRGVHHRHGRGGQHQTQHRSEGGAGRRGGASVRSRQVDSANADQVMLPFLAVAVQEVVHSSFVRANTPVRTGPVSVSRDRDKPGIADGGPRWSDKFWPIIRPRSIRTDYTGLSSEVSDYRACGMQPRLREHLRRPLPSGALYSAPARTSLQGSRVIRWTRLSDRAIARHRGRSQHPAGSHDLVPSQIGASKQHAVRSLSRCPFAPATAAELREDLFPAGKRYTLSPSTSVTSP